MALSTGHVTSMAHASSTASRGTDITDRFTCPGFFAHVREITGIPHPARIHTGDVDWITFINLSNHQTPDIVRSLDGIQHFTALETLVVMNDDIEERQFQLTTLDVSNNRQLQALLLDNNQLSTLDVSNNQELWLLTVRNNRLSELDVSNNPALVQLTLDNNQLTTLDVSNNPALDSLEAHGNQLTTLHGVSNHPALEFLELSNNQLATLDVANTPALRTLMVGNNPLSTLDTSTSPALSGLGASGTNLTTLDVSRNPQLGSLNISNSSLTTLDMSNNPNITWLMVHRNYFASVDDVVGWQALFNEHPINYYDWASPNPPLFIFYPQNTPAQPQSTPTPPPTTTATGLDTASNWARNYIQAAINNGFVPPAMQNNYTSNITRAEFAALVVAMYESIMGYEIMGRVPFVDTTDINVQKAAYLGIITGTGNNNFSPNMQFNREQAAVIVSRLAEAMGQPFPASTPTFADNAAISSWARQQAGQVQAAGIMAGVGGDRFNPQGTFTREQSIITMLRLYEHLG